MRRSPADSTNRSLAAFGKLQHIRETSCPSTSCHSVSRRWRSPGVHRRLPPDVHPRPLGTVQAAGCERQSEGEQAQRECPDQPSSGHRSTRTQRSIQPTCRWLDRDLVSAIMVMTGELT